MNRRIAAVVLALILNPAFLRGQDDVFMVTVPSADVYKGPSNVTPVIGHVSRETLSAVPRDLGGWVRIAWPDAQDGIGYVRTAMGHRGASEAGASSANTSPSSSSAPAGAAPTSASSARTSTGQQITPQRQSRSSEISHVFGVGASLAPMNGVGATARAWHKNRLAIQVGFVRDAVTSDVADGRVTTTGFEPGVAYALFDRVSDYVWIRPYVGSGVTFLHQSWSLSSPLAAPPISDNGMGFRIYGGSEFTFAGMPQFGLSADLGYRHVPAPFAGFKADPLGVSIAGHWYIK